MHHFFEVAGRVSAVLTGQTSVLFIDELKLSEKLLHLTLERLGMKKKLLPTDLSLCLHIHAQMENNWTTATSFGILQFVEK